MKKFIADVYEVIKDPQNPQDNVYFDSTINVTDVNTYAQGKGNFGNNALVKETTISFTIFDSITEATNYDSYSSFLNMTLDDIVKTQDSSKISDIISFLQTYSTQGVMTSGDVAIPLTPSQSVLEAIATIINPQYSTLTSQEQATLITTATSIYTSITNTTP